MTNDQKNQLKLLGFEDTQEDGAILEHRKFMGMARYVWKESTFEDVLSVYALNLEGALTLKIANHISKMEL